MADNILEQPDQSQQLENTDQSLIPNTPSPDLGAIDFNSLGQASDQQLKDGTGPGPAYNPPKPPSFNDLGDRADDILKTYDQFYNSSYLYKPAVYAQKDIRKFDEGFYPLIDNEDRYARDRQGFFSNLGRGVGRFGVGVVAKTGQGVGFIGSLASNAVLDAVQLKWDGVDIINKAADNGFTKVFSGMEDKMKNEWIPTYQEASDRNKGFWWRATHDGDFWMDDVVDGLAFMASAWIPGIALSKLNLGTKIAKLFSPLKVGLTEAEAVVEGAGDAANYLSKANTLFKTTIDKFNAWGLATGSESMFEAAGMRDNIYDSLTYDVSGALRLDPETGLPYSEEKKKRIAGANARNGFLLNTVLLGGTNVMELGWIGSMIGGAKQGVVKGITGGVALGEDVAAEVSSSTNFFGKLVNGKVGAFVGGASKGVIAEGFIEENGQLAIQRINEAYGDKGKISSVFNISELLKQYSYQTKEAIAGRDPEAATNIGIGGILGLAGGRASIQEMKQDKAMTDIAVNTFNNSNQSFLKFGDIYKSEDFKYNDREGKETSGTKIVFDKDNNPVIDAEKVMGIIGGYTAVNSALHESTKIENGFKYDALRDTAWGDLVIAHVHAGIEDTIFGKLDSIKNASPSAIAKLGFTLGDNLDEQIARYKKLTTAIITQNKILNSDVLVKEQIGKKPSADAQIDTARKYRLTTLATQQAVYKNLANEHLAEADKVKNQLLETSNTSLSDGMVDQLNEIQQRINSQKEVIASMEKSGGKMHSLPIAQQILAELEEDQKDLIKNNELTIKELKKDPDTGFYKYEKNQRNEPGFQEQYDKKVKLLGEIKNHVRTLGLDWSKFADTKKGRENFKKYLTEELITPILEEQQKAISSEEKPEKPQPKKTAPTKVKVPFENEEGEDDEFEFENGKTYKVTNEDGSIDYYNDIQISPDGKTITYDLNFEGRVEGDIEEMAKFAKESGWEPFVRAGRGVKKGPVVKTKTEHPEELDSDSHIEEDPDEPTYSSDGKKPKFEEVGFNKVFGKHYLDENDKELNEEFGTARFYAFTSKFDTGGGNYVLKVVTENNDDFGIRQPDVNEDDVKVILMKKTVDKRKNVTYNYVDVDNNILEDEEANKDNIIYRSLSNIKNATPDSIREIYTVDDSTPDDLIQEQIDLHTEWQEGLKARTKKGDVLLEVKGNSPGIQRVERTSAINKDGSPLIAMAPVAGRVIQEDPDWSDLRSASNPDNHITLLVNTRDGALAPGLLAGRAVMKEFYYDIDGKPRFTNKTTRVFNRLLNDEEKETVANALARLSELMGRTKKNPLSLEEKNEYTLVLDYLKGIVSWGSPKEGISPNKFVWVESGLHINGEVYKFDRDTIMTNKDAILDGMYHHINNKMLWGSKASFQDITFKNDKAVPKGDLYATYEEYLLADRENGEVPPVYTSLPKIDSKYPQRTSSYVMWRDPAQAEMKPIGSIERTYKTPKKGKKPTNAKTKTTGSNKVTKRSSALDKVIDDFLNYKTKKISIYGVQLEHVKKGKSFHIGFYNPRTNFKFLSNPYSSVKELIAGKYGLKALIGKITKYDPSGKAASTTSSKTKTGSKTSTTTKREISLAASEDLILAGEASTTIRSDNYHQKFYNGDGFYKTESGTIVNVEYKGKIKLKNGRIWGKNINMSKQEFADAEGFKSWEDYEVNATKWAAKNFVEGEAVHYYEITIPEEGDEDTPQQTGKRATTWDEIDNDKNASLSNRPANRPANRTKKTTPAPAKGKKATTWDEIDNDPNASLSNRPGQKTGRQAPPTRSTKSIEELRAQAKANREAAGKNIQQSTNMEIPEGVFTNMDEAIANAVQKGNTLTGVLHNFNEQDGEIEIAAQATVNIPNGNIIAGKALLKRTLQSKMPTEEEEIPWRMPVEQIEEKEDFKKLSSFMRSKLPQFPVKRMANMIHGKALGAFYKGAVYIYENAGYGTGFHEAFESVWASYLTDEERQALATEFRNKQGSFTNPFSRETKAYRDASMYDVREMLSEGLAEVVKDDLDNQTFTGKIGEFFRNLWNTIKELFGLNKTDRTEFYSNINDVYKAIGKGKFRNLTPIRELNTVAPAYKQVGALSQSETAEVLDGLNYHFFTELYTRGNNINTILGNLSKIESNALLAEIFDSSFIKVVNSLTLYPNVQTQLDVYKQDLYKIFKSNFERYGVQFKELEQDEDDITDTLGIRDSVTIDPRKSTNANVRLLLASIPESKYNNAGKRIIVKSQDLKQPKLVNGDKLHLILLNELSNIVPIVMKNGERKNVINQMFEKLDLKYKNDDTTYKKDYAWIHSLKTRLKYEEADGTLVDASELSKEDMQLRVAFLKSFTNLKMNPEKTIVGEDGYIYNFNPLNELNTDRIRAEWSNNIKVQIQNRNKGIVTLDPSGVMIIDRSTAAYAEIMGYLDFKSKLDLDDITYILGRLGIEFSAKRSELEPYFDSLRSHTIQILELIRNAEINSINELYGNQSIGGRINDLLSIESRFSSEDNVLSYLNADGESEYAVGNTSLFSNMVNILNTVNSIEELVRTCPWLGSMETTEDGQVYPRLNAYQAGSDLFKPGGLLFDKNGKRKPGLANQVTFHNIAGMGLTNEEGSTTANLLFPERVANKIHYLMNNIALTNINSDKSREYGVGLPGKMLVGRDDVSKFIENGTSKVITDKYVTQLKAEMAAAVQQKQNPVFIQYYQKGVYTLGHFRDILSKKLIDKFKEEVLSNNPKYVITDEKPDVYTDFMNDNMGQITKEINNYLKKEIIKTSDWLIDLDIFEKVPVKGSETYISYAVDNNSIANLLKIGYDLDKKTSADNQVVTYKNQDTGEKVTRLAFTEDDIDTLAGILLINEELLLGEQHKLIYGHPAMYLDLAKRVSGATATKEAFVEDSDVIAWQDKNMVRNDGKIRSNDVHQTTKIITFKNQDVVSLFYKDIVEGIYADMLEAGISKSEAQKKTGATFNDANEITGYIKDGSQYTGAVKSYMNMDEADGMCWGMPDTIRDMLFSTAKLTPQQEKQWDYEIAYEKVARSKLFEKDSKTGKITYLPGYKSYQKEELKKAQDVLDEEDPGYIFQVLKPQYFGYADTKTVTHPVFLKHAVQPKFYRHVEGTQFEKLYLAAQDNQVDLIGFVSGQKVGSVTDTDGEFIPIYNEEGIVNVTKGKNKGYKLPENLPQLKIFSKFYGIQVEISNKAKNSVVRGTQITKLVMVNFFENGKPINAELGELIVEYNNTLRSMIQMGKVQVLKELGLVKTDEGYVTQDLTKLITILRKEANDRDLPDNMIDAINALKNENGTQTLEYSFDTLINREKIDNILNSIVDSRVISEKMSGKASVQVASTLYESNPRGFMYLKNGVYKTLTAKEIKALTEEEKASVRMTSSDLKFYRNENGKITGMDAYISWPFKEVTPEELGLKLENGIYKIPDNRTIPGLPEQLLKAIGFRIPTQASNSIENIIIKGFTPAVNGDMIVVPSEIVGKSGSDFDIDKLNLYLAHYHVDGVNYNSPEFRQFMINDMGLRGIPAVAAERFLDGFTVEDLKKINKAAPTDNIKHLKNLTTSIQDLSETVDDFRETKIIKDALQNYNKQFKGVKKLVYTEPGTDTKEALQNKFIEVTRKLIERPENYAQLVTPNTTATLKGLATEITKAKVAAGTKMEEDEKSPTFLRSFVGSSQIRERYITAKRMVGIAALHSTFHSMAQVAGIKLNKEFKTNAIHYLMIKEKGQYPDFKNMNIKLKHKERDEQGYFEVGHRRDVVGQMISDLFSEGVSGFVDGAKDPFVFDLNFSLNSVGTWFYLTHLGVLTEQIAYFFNQPIMDEYFKEQSKNRSNFKVINNQNLTKEELFYKVIAPYYNKVHKGDLLKDIAIREAFPKPWELMNFKKTIAIKNNKINDGFEEFDLEKLKKNINAGKAADPKMQIAILMNYIEYEAQARMLGNFMQGISYDNKKTRTIQENQLQVARWNRSKNEKFINNPEAILEQTFLGELKEQKEDIFDMFKGFFITLTPELQKAFQPMYDKLNNPEYVSSKDDMINLLNRYQNFVLTYVLHTTAYKNSDGQQETLNQLYKEMFTGKKTIAKALYEYKKDGDPAIADNLIIKELLPMFTDDISSTNNIKLFKSKMDTFQVNNVIDALDNLKGYALNIGDLELSNFVDNLVKFSILQSGMQSSSVDFKKILSRHTYSNFVKVILENYSKNPEVDVDNIWKNFHQNNWTNRSIVPKAPSWIKVTNGTFLVKATSSVATNDFVVKSVKKAYLNGKPVTSAVLRKLAKEKRLFEAFDMGLFYNTGLVDMKNRVTYEMIDKKGNGSKFSEIYKDDTPSILPKNLMEKIDPTKKGTEDDAGWSSVATAMAKRQKAKDRGNQDPEEVETEERTKGFTLSIDKKGKDQGKADLANAYIGFGQSNTNTYTYMKDAQKQSIPINDEIEAGLGTIAFASVNGNGVATQEAIEATIAAAKSVIEEGGTVVMDSNFDANRPWNKKGELIIQTALGQPDGKTAKNYNYWGPNPEIESTYDDDDVVNTEAVQEEKEVDDVLKQKEDESEECNPPF